MIGGMDCPVSVMISYTGNKILLALPYGCSQMAWCAFRSRIASYFAIICQGWFRFSSQALLRRDPEHAPDSSVGPQSGFILNF